jgi:hypothetical protein
MDGVEGRLDAEASIIVRDEEEEPQTRVKSKKCDLSVTVDTEEVSGSFPLLRTHDLSVHN